MINAIRSYVLSTKAGQLHSCWPGRWRCCPPQVCGRPRVRADAGYFDQSLAHAAVERGCDFAIAAKRNPAVWRALAGIPKHAWSDARDMPGGQVAARDYTPAGWPEGSYCIVRRVKVTAEQISTDSRSRRRRTIPAGQLTLALDGQAEHAWACSFIVTNIPADDGPDIVGLEAWFRRRTSIEDRFRDGKHGGGLNHLPSGDHTVNTVWAWAALLAGAITVMLQALIGWHAHHGERTRPPTLRHRLLTIRPGPATRSRADPAPARRSHRHHRRPTQAPGTPTTRLTIPLTARDPRTRRHRPPRRATRRAPTPTSGSIKITMGERP